MQRFLFASLAAITLTATAEAHFLFIQIGPHAEAGRTVEVFFSERATAGDPLFVPKIAHTELWLQDEPGKFTPLSVSKGTDRLRGYLPSDKPLSVAGRCEYGVLKRDKPFLLRYYPKAVSGNPAEVAKLGRFVEEVPLEIVPSFAKDSITLTVLREGQPVPNAVLTTIDLDLINEELKTDAAGRATWKLAAPGQYAVYVKHVLPETGLKDGQRYEEIREFATLAFDWPLDGSHVDEAAVAMFNRAIAARANWQEFPGFTAKVDVYLDGRDSSGIVVMKRDGDVEFGDEPKLDDAAREWVADQLHSIAIHRLPASGIRSEPRLCFSDTDESHPLGRLLTFHGGRFASTYRVRDDELTVVNRALGSENMSLQMLDSERNAEGKVLPRAYVVQYRDAATGGITRIETFRSRWQRVGLLDLPESIEQSTSSAAGVTVRRLTLKSHGLAQ